MSLSKEEWQSVKGLRDSMAEFRDFCRGKSRVCCGDPDYECPIAMGEWWTDEENERLKRVSNILFPDAI